MLLWRPFYTVRIKYSPGSHPITSETASAVSAEATANGSRCSSILRRFGSPPPVEREFSSLTALAIVPRLGVCVGAGTIAFFLLFQKGGPLSSVPAILAVMRHHGHCRYFVFQRGRRRFRRIAGDSGAGRAFLLP